MSRRHPATIPAPRHSRAEARARARLGRRRTSRLEMLESRAVPAVIGFEADVFPKLINPRSGYVSVLVTGTARVDGKTPPKINYQLVDEYRVHQTDARGPVGPRAVSTSPVTTDPGLYSFKFRLRIPAQVKSQDTSGRQFALSVAARHGNNSAGKSFPILIPNPNSPRPKPPLTQSAQAALAQAARRSARAN